MANINYEASLIKMAIYGEEVRDAIISALRKVANEGTDLSQLIDAIESELTAKIDKNTAVLANPDLNLYFDDDEKLLYITYNGEIIGDGIAVSTGGGGGGGGGGGSSMYFYKPTLTNALEDRAITTTKGTEVTLKFNYASVDETGADDGPGVGRIVISGQTKKSFRAIQGLNEVNVTDILEVGANNVSVKVENSEGTIRSLNYTVTVVTLDITSTTPEISSAKGTAQVNYTVNGTGEKIVHFVLDGTEIGTETVTTSGRSRTYYVDEQPHGSHILEIYATSEIDGLSLTSDRLRMCIYWIGSSATPIIATPFNESSITEGEILSIDYAVYDPSNEQATVVLSIIDDNGDVYSTQTITKDRSTGDPWVVSNYPVGEHVVFRIACGTTVKNITMEVEEYAFPISKVTDALLMEFSAEGRANTEANPATWSYGNDISATFNGFVWSASDGWQHDSENASVLRFLPGDSMSINFKPFENDARATGYTIEVDMATRDVRDYNSIVVDCMNAGRGLEITSQNALMASEQTSVSMLFKEDSRIRVTFVIEQSTQNRMIYIYINGIMCSAKQYPINDNFAQNVPQVLTIGSQYCGLDLYKIRCYGKGLNRNEVVDNLIIDKATLRERQDAFTRNNVLNEAENISIDDLPADLPYMVFAGDELPQYKGDKRPMTVTFVDPSDTTKSFVSIDAQIDVQGTTSQKYPVKNYKIKAKNGFTNNGSTTDKYALRTGDIPVNSFCIKVDYASSENANNVQLVQLYEDICREQGFLTPPQEEDARVRQGIAGRPIVLFWHDTVHNETIFLAKANFNNDKGTPETFGFDQYENSQSWEFRNNTSNICLFKTGDFTNWENDLEAREPDGGTDTSLVQPVFAWVAAHDRSTVSTQAEKDEMLADFKEHFEEHFVLNNMLFYYLFTEIFLMIDSRAKNMFLTTYDGVHWLPLPYDMDTALGITNDGELVFDYGLEDTDKINGGNIYNGQDSVLWANVRDAYSSELAAMYRTLRSGRFFRYEVVKQRFLNHQDAWPERIWNEDSYIKYIVPFLGSSEEGMTEDEKKERRDRLAMLQGDKRSQRDWWLYNAFKYRDSKYKAGEAMSNVIIIRGYTDESHPIADQDLTIKPYSDIYAMVQYGSVQMTKRMVRNESHTFDNPMATMTNTEIYVYSADRISEIGDLSPMNLGEADFGAATKLNQLIIGSSAAGYENTHLHALTVGSNELLTLLNICNCSALETNVDLSGCLSIETVLATGSHIRGVQLPVGGHLTRLELPATVTNLTIRNQSGLNTFVMEGYSNLSTLRIENTPNVPLETILNNATDNLGRVRLVGIEWTAASSNSLKTTIDRLDTCHGLDINDGNLDKPVVNGRVNINPIDSDLLIRIQNDYPELVVVVNGNPQFVVHYLNYDGSTLYNQVVSEGGSATDPVAGGLISAPTRPDDGDTSYTYNGWEPLPTNIHSNSSVTAQYTEAYKVKYVNDDGTVLQTNTVVRGQSTSYTGSTPTKESTAQYTYDFKEWSGADDRATGAISQVMAPRTVTATYTNTVRQYTATFYAENRTTVLQSSQVAYGSSASYTGETPVSSDGYTFDGWEPASMVITADTNFYPKFLSPVEDTEIADSWDAIIDNMANGLHATAYKLGNYKPLDVGSEGTVNMQIVAMDDEKGPLTFIAKELLSTNKQMNSTQTNDNGYPATNVIKPWLGNRVYPLLPAVIRNAVKPVTLKSYNYTTGGDITHTEKLWIPSAREILGGSSYEQSGPVYTQIYKDAVSRKKMKVGTSSASSWWLRSAYPGMKAVFVFVGSRGSVSGGAADSSNCSVCLAFTLSPETISDSWAEIDAAVTNGTYKTKYNIGDTKALDLGDQGNILMQIAAFDADELADGSGTAAITWVAKQLLVTKSVMNSSKTNADGYPASDMKTYMEGTIWGKIPSTVQALIQTVKKTSYDKTTAADLTSNLKVWIPSAREIFGGSDYEQSGPVYSDLFVDAKSRKKNVYGSSSAVHWWLRSAHSGNGTVFREVYPNGDMGSNSASSYYGVCLGFCTGITPTT